VCVKVAEGVGPRCGGRLVGGGVLLAGIGLLVWVVGGRVGGGESLQRTLMAGSVRGMCRYLALISGSKTLMESLACAVMLPRTAFRIAAMAFSDDSAAAERNSWRRAATSLSAFPYAVSMNFDTSAAFVSSTAVSTSGAVSSCLVRSTGLLDMKSKYLPSVCLVTPFAVDDPFASSFTVSISSATSVGYFTTASSASSTASSSSAGGAGGSCVIFKNCSSSSGRRYARTQSRLLEHETPGGTFSAPWGTCVIRRSRPNLRNISTVLSIRPQALLKHQ